MYTRYIHVYTPTYTPLNTPLNTLYIRPIYTLYALKQPIKQVHVQQPGLEHRPGCLFRRLRLCHLLPLHRPLHLHHFRVFNQVRPDARHRLRYDQVNGLYHML